MIIALANQKGGVGKTTTTLNLGVYLAELKKKVLLVDMDPQGNLTSGSGAREELKNNAAPTIYDVLLGDAEADKAVLKLAVGVDLIPANIELAGAEVELVNTLSREGLLKEKLAKLTPEYDLILVDCPPSLGLLTINALVAAEGIVIPVQSEYYALEGISQLLNTIKLVQQKLNSKLELRGIAITMFDGRTNLSRDVAQELSSAFPKKVFNTIIPRNIRLSEAPSHGQPISVYDPKSQGALSYRNLAKELAARISK